MLTAHPLRIFRWPAAALAAAMLGAVLTVPTAPASAGGFSTQEVWVSSGSGPHAAVLDTTVYLPASATRSTPAAAVILAHGFGGSKDSESGRATGFARAGYVVLTYSARGFGQSSGQISVNAPDREIADARAMIDVLAIHPEVRQDAPGDPRVAIYGSSLGGALGLLTAGYDDRVDAIAAKNTWNSLVSSFFPNSAGAPEAGTPAAGAGVADDGVFKQLWAQLFFALGSEPIPAGRAGPARPVDPLCGRFHADFCAAYHQAVQTGRLSAGTKALLEASSPASVLDRITAPTLLIQGGGDTLFPLDEADATARGIAAAGTPVKVTWTTHGHGVRREAHAAAEAAQVERSALRWFDFHLRGAGPDPGTSFDLSTTTTPGTATGQPGWTNASMPAYPGLAGDGAPRGSVELAGPAQQILNPAGGTPAAISTLPPMDGGRRGAATSTEIPGQAATFTSAPAAGPVRIVGSPVVSVRVASSSGGAVLFGKLYDVDPHGQATLLRGPVAPVRLGNLPGTLGIAAPGTITLPAIVHTVAAGHRLQLVLASTDQGYATPLEPARYDVALASATMSFPGLAGAPPPDEADPHCAPKWWWDWRCDRLWQPVPTAAHGPERWL